MRERARVASTAEAVAETYHSAAVWQVAIATTVTPPVALAFALILLPPAHLPGHDVRGKHSRVTVSKVVLEPLRQ